MDATTESILKLWGPFGLIVVGLVLFIWKKLLPDLEKREAAYREVLTSALDDARKERDQERKMREAELSRYMESMKYRDEQFKPLAEAINANRPRREKQQ